MSQKKRSVILSNTVYSKLEVLVSTGEYSDIDDAATDLLMQSLRGTTPVPSQVLPKRASELAVLESTTPVLTSTTPVLILVEPAIEPISESHSEELARLLALSGGQKFKAMNRITELKQILEV